MPLVAILSDVHSNLLALEAVLADAQAQGATEFLCLGDVVGYGARPKECVKLVQDSCAIVVRGNHDWAATVPAEAVTMNPMAFAGILYSHDKLSKKAMKWLHDLPLVERHRGMTLVHSSLENPEEFPYIFTPEDAEASFRYQKTSVCFTGHTHLPRLYSTADGQQPRRVGELQFYLPPHGRYMVNVGSVGQPRNEDPRAQYALYHTIKRMLEFRRVEYDAVESCAQILDAGLPKELGQRLIAGL